MEWPITTRPSMILYGIQRPRWRIPRRTRVVPPHPILMHDGKCPPAIVECASPQSTYVYLGRIRTRRTRSFGPALRCFCLAVNGDAESFLCLSFEYFFCLIRIFCFLFLVCSVVYIVFFLLLFSIACCLLSMFCHRFRIISLEGVWEITTGISQLLHTSCRQDGGATYMRVGKLSTL